MLIPTILRSSLLPVAGSPDTFTLPKASVTVVRGRVAHANGVR